MLKIKRNGESVAKGGKLRGLFESAGVNAELGQMALGTVGTLLGGFRKKKPQGEIAYDSSEDQMIDGAFNEAKAQHDANESNKFKTEVNIPAPVQTPTGGNAAAGGKSSQPGLDNSMVLRNPDSIIRSVALSMMSNSV